MNYNSFAEGLMVEYLHIFGPIKFICHKYITVCVNTENEKPRQTNILIYEEYWNDVKIYKQSSK